MATSEEFEWHVAKSGHRWEKARLMLGGGAEGELEWLLSDWQPAGELKVYCPLRDYSGLFRTFADLADHFDDIGSLDKANRTREALKAFADRYGMLGMAKGISRWSTPEADPAGPKQWLELLGERLTSDWTDSIFAIRHAVDLWNLLQASDMEGLSRVIVWGQDRVSYHSPQLQDLVGKHPCPAGQCTAPIASKIESPEIYRRFQKGDVIEPAWLRLERVIDAHLQEHTETHFRRRNTQDSPVIYPYPRNLLGAIWLQFARAVSGNKEYRTCKECERWFEVSFPTAKTKDVRRSRADQQYCSTACRSKAYRDRQEQARRMHAEGKTPREIANALGSELATIKKWIGGARR